MVKYLSISYPAVSDASPKGREKLLFSKLLPWGFHHQDLSGCHCLLTYGKGITDHVFSVTVLYCKEVPCQVHSKSFLKGLQIVVAAKVSVWDLDLIPVSGAVLFFAISGSAETGTKTEQTSV